jgi:hypothetical protein
MKGLSIQNPVVGFDREGDYQLEQEVAGREDVYIITVDTFEFAVGPGCDYEDGEDFIKKRSVELGSIDKVAEEMSFEELPDFIDMLIDEDIDEAVKDAYAGYPASDIKKEG